MQVTRHRHIQREQRRPGRIPGRHVQRQDRRRLRDAEQLDLLRGSGGGRSPAQPHDPPERPCAWPGEPGCRRAAGSSSGQARCPRPARGGNHHVTTSEASPVLADRAACGTPPPGPSASPAAPRSSVGAKARPTLTSSPGLPGLVPVQFAPDLAGPRHLGQRGTAADETALALLGLDPALLPQHPQRTDHGRPGRSRTLAESWCSLGISDPGGYSPLSIRRCSSAITCAYFGGVYS